MKEPNLTFYASNLPAPSNEYVAWVDLMGTACHMQWSTDATANFIYKIHLAAIQLKPEGLRLYTIMDGFYATSENSDLLKSFLQSLYTSLFDHHSNERAVHFRFVLRGAVAYGGIIHGSSLPREVCHTLAENPTYRDSICIGIPISDANAMERQASPFGIAIHPSAAHAFEPMLGEPRWWRWFSPDMDLEKTRRLMTEYFAYFRFHPERNYDETRLNLHDAMAGRYFR